MAVVGLIAVVSPVPNSRKPRRRPSLVPAGLRCVLPSTLFNDSEALLLAIFEDLIGNYPADEGVF